MNNNHYLRDAIVRWTLMGMNLKQIQFGVWDYMNRHPHKAYLHADRITERINADA